MTITQVLCMCLYSVSASLLAESKRAEIGPGAEVVNDARAVHAVLTCIACLLLWKFVAGLPGNT